MNVSDIERRIGKKPESYQHCTGLGDMSGLSADYDLLSDQHDWEKLRADLLANELKREKTKKEAYKKLILDLHRLGKIRNGGYTGGGSGFDVLESVNRIEKDH